MVIAHFRNHQPHRFAVVDFGQRSLHGRIRRCYILKEI
jgi:hypothetical protein